MNDPKRINSTNYPLLEVTLLTICAVICGADGFTSVASFGHAKKDWLGRFLKLENGIPLMTPLDDFSAYSRRWVEAACEHVNGEIVAVDGKTLRRSYDRSSN